MSLRGGEGTVPYPEGPKSPEDTGPPPRMLTSPQYESSRRLSLRSPRNPNHNNNNNNNNNSNDNNSDDNNNSNSNNNNNNNNINNNNNNNNKHDNGKHNDNHYTYVYIYIYRVLAHHLAPACATTPNLPTKNLPAKIAWLKFCGKLSMDIRIPPLNIKIMLESNPLKSRILVRRLGVRATVSRRACLRSIFARNWVALLV